MTYPIPIPIWHKWFIRHCTVHMSKSLVEETESEQEAPERKAKPGCHALDVDPDTGTVDPCGSPTIGKIWKDMKKWKDPRDSTDSIMMYDTMVEDDENGSEYIRMTTEIWLRKLGVFHKMQAS